MEGKNSPKVNKLENWRNRDSETSQRMKMK